jgi:hypothetical protein
MELTFSNRALAETCNCEQLMVSRWGDDGFACVSERLLQLAAAADVSQIEALPYATLEHGARGAVSIEFSSGETVVRGVLLDGSGRAASPTTDGVRLRILALHIATKGDMS